MDRAVVCMVDSLEHADRILSELLDSYFANEDISVLHPDRMGVRDFAPAVGSKAPEGAVIGAVTGGCLGGAVGLALGSSLGVVPAVAAFVAAGPLMAALGGTALGAAGGGVVGSLLGVRVPRYEVRPYRARLERHTLVISVHVENELARERACWILAKEGADAISTMPELPVPQA